MFCRSACSGWRRSAQLEAPHRLVPVLALDGALAGRVVLVARREIGIDLVRLGERAGRRRRQRRADQHGAEQRAGAGHRWATVFAFTSSGRIVSASLASATSFW